MTDGLQSRLAENVFVAGDAAQLSPPVAKQDFHALDMGEAAAGNLSRFLRGQDLKPYQPSFELALISFGDLDTYLVAGKRVVAGTLLAPLN